MVQESKTEAALALHRFGLGPRPGSIAAIASDPRGALIAELERPRAGRIDHPELMTSAQASRAAFEARASAARTSNRRATRAEKERQAGGPDAMAAAGAEGGRPARPPAPRNAESHRRSSGRSSCRRSRPGSTRRSTPRSALPSGWSGSGRTISASRPTRCRSMAGGYEREAIRAACARPLRRHAARRRRPSGDADLSRQRALDRARTRSPASTATAA